MGNLAFSTKKEDIQAEFAKAGSMQVSYSSGSHPATDTVSCSEDVQIITRGTRSMGCVVSIFPTGVCVVG